MFILQRFNHLAVTFNQIVIKTKQFFMLVFLINKPEVGVLVFVEIFAHYDGLTTLC
jgi:hypothetical protein